MKNNFVLSKNKIVLLTTFALLASVSAPLLCAGDREEDDEIPVLTFSTVGDSRQDPTAPDPSTLPVSAQDALWLENTKALSRILRTIESQRSSLLFFNGDMIMGYGNAIVPTRTATVTDIVGSDLVKFYQQYAFWRGAVAGTMENGTYIIPVAGNHEVQWKAGGKKAQVANEDAWRANMGDLILDTNRFLNLFGEQPSNANTADNRAYDNLSSDQSKLSYSFDFHGAHFAIINTDPVGKDAHAPVNWLAADLQAAKDRGVRKSFVFGHKPAFTYYYGADILGPLPATPSGLDNDPASRDLFWNVIEQFEATYFCGHEHIFNIMQPRGKAWQILVGSGGSPFEVAPGLVTLNPATDRDYAWATVKLLPSGKVRITAFGFDEHFGPTRILQSLTIH